MERIKILSMEQKNTSSGKERWLAHTEQGDMAIWDSAIAKGLMGMKDTYFDAEIKVNGDFKNIQKLMPCNQDPVVTTEKIGPKWQPANVATMYTSYAKDIFIALKNPALPARPETDEGLMQAAINLVKQAKGCFEG